MKKIILAALLALTACATTPPEPKTITVHDQVAVLPPKDLLAPCISMPSDGSVGGELKRLSDLVVCQRNKAAAIQAWGDTATTVPAPAGTAKTP